MTLDAGDVPTAPAHPGLTAAQVAERLAIDGPNTLPRPTPPALARRLLTHAREPLSLVLLGAAVLSGAVLGHLVEALAIAAIVALNVAIGASQEHRADAAVAALADLTAPTARARRDGRTELVAARDLVVGDVVELSAGDRVPADVHLHDAARVAVDESTLTGESLPVEKSAGDDAYAGTLIVRGVAVGGVTATGPRTELGRIATALAGDVTPPIVHELRRVAAKMSTVAVALGGALVLVALVRQSEDGSFGDALVAGIALAVAAIPEGLPAVVTSALALGARGMAAQGAIVRRLPAVETLGATTVLCTDKTGTLTTGQLTVVDARPVEAADALWRAAVRCVDPGGGHGDPVDVAIDVAARAAGVGVSTAPRLAVLPFDPATRSMTTVVREPGGPIVSVKGAPEVVLDRCAPGPEVERLRAEARTLMTGGARVLAVASAAGTDTGAELRADGLIAFADPLRPSARAAVADCRRAGIRIVMVTGDHTATAAAIALDAGLDAGVVVAGDEVADLDPATRARRLREADVVARVRPETKVALVDAHRAAGEVVAMTGDGVNDAPALRAADIGVAIAGGGGTDVAREASDVVVTSEDLGTIVAAIREGRRIYRNLTVVVGYLVTGNLSEIVTVAAALVLLPELAVPFLPVQLLWLNLISDGLPAVALGVDHPPDDPLAAPPRQPGSSLLGPRRMTVLALRSTAIAAPVMATALLARRWQWDEPAIRSQLLLALLAAHVVHAYTSRARRFTFERGWSANRSLLAAIGASLALQLPVFCTAQGRDVFGIAALPPRGWALAATAAMAAVVTIDLARVTAARYASGRTSLLRQGRDRGSTTTRSS